MNTITDLKNRMFELELEIPTKHIAFLKEYLRNGYDMKKAYMSVYINAKESTAGRQGYELLKDTKCAEYVALNIHELEPILNINKIKQIENYLKIANDLNEKTAIRLKAMERVDKLLRYESAISIDLNLFDKGEISTDNLSDEQKEQLLKIARSKNN